MKKSTTAHDDRLAELLSKVSLQDIKAISKQILSVDDRKQYFAQLCKNNLEFWTAFSAELGSHENVEFDDAMLGAILAISVLSRRSNIEYLQGSFGKEFLSKQPTENLQQSQ